MTMRNCMTKLKKFHHTRSTLLFCTTTTTTIEHHVNNGVHDILSPENKQRTIDALSNPSANYIHKLDSFVGGKLTKTAAVLVPLCYDLQHRPSILFNVRSLNLRSHRGQISFPGGGVDSQDKDDVINTALRETEEELGIDRSQVEIWTVLPYVPTVTSLMRVAPVLAFIKDPVDLDPKLLPVNPNEVAFAFTLPILEHLCDQNNWGMSNYVKNCQSFCMPEFRNLQQFMPTDAKKRIILWGMTSLITHVVLSALVPNSYQRDVLITRGINSASTTVDTTAVKS